MWRRLKWVNTHFWKTSLSKGSIFWSVPKAIPRLIRQKSGKFIKCLTTFQIFKSVHGLSQVSVAQIFLELEIRVWKLYESLTILLKSPERFIFPRLQNLDIPEQMTETRSVGKIWFPDRKNSRWNGIPTEREVPTRLGASKISVAKRENSPDNCMKIRNVQFSCSKSLLL